MSDQGIIWEEDAKSDPSIQGRTVRVRFVESKYNFQTTINGTRDEIANYYCGAKLNVENYPNEVLRTPRRLDFLPDSEDGQTVSYDLPDSKRRLYRGYTIEGNGYGYAFASTGIDGAEDSNDGRYGHCQSVAECKRVIDEQIADAQWKEGDNDNATI